MSDSSLNAAEAVPEQVDAAQPDPVENEAPQGDDPQESQEPRTFTQEELDKIIAKEKAKAERAVRRELAQVEKEPVYVPVGDAPQPGDFDSALDYADALADYKVNQKIAAREAEKYRTTIETTYDTRAEKARDKYDDFDDVVLNPDLRITDAMADVIKESEVGPEVAYYLGTNPKEADRIANLSPLSQAREIGKLEAALSANPPAKKVTSAPAPISPVRRGSSAHTVDPSDPRSVKAMSDAEWIKARNAQVAKKYS